LKTLAESFTVQKLADVNKIENAFKTQTLNYKKSYEALPSLKKTKPRSRSPRVAWKYDNEDLVQQKLSLTQETHDMAETVKT